MCVRERERHTIIKRGREKNINREEKIKCSKKEKRRGYIWRERDSEIWSK